MAATQAADVSDRKASGVGLLLPEVAEFARKHGLDADIREELQGLMNATITLAQKRVTVAVPATVANLGPGLETFGMALDIWDEFSLEYAEEFCLEVFGDADGEVPRNKDDNLCVVGASTAFEAAGRPFPKLKVTCTHGVPFNKGLGAPSASFVGGYLAGSVLCSEELAAFPSGKSSVSKTHSFADMLGGCGASRNSSGGSSPKQVASGGGVDVMLQAAISRGWNPGHVCPAIYGALQIGVLNPTMQSSCRSHRVPVPHGLVCVIFVPDGLAEGPGLSEQPVDRKAAIFNVGRTALLVNCFCHGKFEMFGKAVQDTLAQQQWTSKFPFLSDVMQAAVAAGAAGATPCGYGPSVMALITGRTGDVLAQSSSNELERSVAKAMLSKAEELGTTGQILIAKPADVGAHVVAQKSDLGVPEDNNRISYFQ